MLITNKSEFYNQNIYHLRHVSNVFKNRNMNHLEATHYLFLSI